MIFRVMSSWLPTKSTKFAKSSMTKLLAFIAFLAVSTPAIAQQVSPRQPTPQQIRRAVAEFQSGVSQGCLKSAPKGVSAPTSYCSCYAKSFIERYSPDELAAISNQALRNPQSAFTINLMMKPEARACAAIQRPSVR
jgi:hypothetical protein